jgi:hypothetical protein
VERRILIGNVRVELDAGFAAILGIDVAGGFGMATGLEPLPI